MSILSASRVLVPAAQPGGRPPLAGPVDLSIDKGEVLAVAGPSGSGKTTLLRCLAMLEPLAQGEVRFRRKPVPDADVPAFRRQVVYVQQSPRAFPGRVRESLSRAFTFATARGTYDADRATRLRRRLRLPDDIFGARVADLSGGEAQRIAIIRAVLLEPTVLLLDEPTSGLDPDARDAVEELLAEWRAAGERATVLVSHDVEQAARLATKRLTLEGPRVGDVA